MRKATQQRRAAEPDDAIALPPVKRRQPVAVRRLGRIQAARPIRVWQDVRTGQICFRPHRRRKVLRRTLAELWDLLNGQGTLL